jgi:hypothetical protein
VDSETVLKGLSQFSRTVLDSCQLRSQK